MTVYKAVITTSGKEIFVGYFDTFSEAVTEAEETASSIAGDKKISVTRSKNQ